MSGGFPGSLLRLSGGFLRGRYGGEEGCQYGGSCPGLCHGMVPILLGELPDLGKRPLSIAMATGISMVRLVALATSPSASLA
jgi:hypothetical protein